MNQQNSFTDHILHVYIWAKQHTTVPLSSDISEHKWAENISFLTMCSSYQYSPNMKTAFETVHLRFTFFSCEA